MLAEKLETVVSRGLANTRPRDFYDIHVLWALHSKSCDIETLREALNATCGKRGSMERMALWKRALDEVERDNQMLAL